MDKIAGVSRTPPPSGFARSSAVSSEQVRALPAIGQQAMHRLERCIKTHHVAEVDYTDAEGRRSAIRLRPAYIRSNAAHHVVVWGLPSDAEHWEELRLDRIHAVRDTGERFEPTW